MMTDAPERIWAWVDDLAGVVGSTNKPETPPNLPPGPNALTLCAEYLRADLCDRNAILEEAAKMAERYSAAYAVPPPSDMDNDEAEYFLDGARDGATAVAAALRAMKEAK